MSEQYQNFAYGTATNSLGTGNPVTIDLNTGAGAAFPATTNGPFRITVQEPGLNTVTEVMIVTTRATDVLTAYRGTAISTYGAAEVPTPTISTWAAGAVVSHNLTAGVMNQIREDSQRIVFSGTLPADGRYGDILYPSDDLVTSGYNGTSFIPHDIHFPLRGNPQSQTWTTFGQAGGTVTNRSQSIVFTGTALTTSALQGQYITTPATPYSIIATFIPVLPNTQYAHCGVVLSDGTKFIEFDCLSQAANQIELTCSTYSGTSNSYAGAVSVAPNYFISNVSPLTFCISNNGTNMKFGISPDGGLFIVGLATSGVGSYLTPTKAGYFVDSNDSNYPVSLVLLNWYVATNTALF